jgi:hypothetical protein
MPLCQYSDDHWVGMCGSSRNDRLGNLPTRLTPWTLCVGNRHQINTRSRRLSDQQHPVLISFYSMCIQSNSTQVPALSHTPELANKALRPRPWPWPWITRPSRLAGGPSAEKPRVYQLGTQTREWLDGKFLNSIPRLELLSRPDLLSQVCNRLGYSSIVSQIRSRRTGEVPKRDVSCSRSPLLKLLVGMLLPHANTQPPQVP